MQNVCPLTYPFWKSTSTPKYTQLFPIRSINIRTWCLIGVGKKKIMTCQEGCRCWSVGQISGLDAAYVSGINGIDNDVSRSREGVLVQWSTKVRDSNPSMHGRNDTNALYRIQPGRANHLKLSASGFLKRLWILHSNELRHQPRLYKALILFFLCN